MYSGSDLTPWPPSLRGHDASDCHENFTDGAIALRADPFGNDGAAAANDGSCDDPYFKTVESPADGPATPVRIYFAASLARDAMRVVSGRTGL